jgi:hypothetical protein
MTRLLSSLRFRYGRWRGIRAAERGLPPAREVERGLIGDLREGCRRLPVQVTEGCTPNEADWRRAMNRLRQLALRSDPRAFLRWDVIIERMAPRDSSCTPVELAALQASPDWEDRWRPAIQEIAAGRPFPYAGHPESSEHLIQTAYTLSRFEALAGRPVAEWDTVIEFGGGFGSLCRLAHRLGFTGRYVIFDLAPFTLLQRYYLRSAGIMRDGEDRIVLTSELADLERVVAELAPDAWATFIACWSLSETPLTLRASVHPIVERIGRYCIAYQERYGEVDNVEFFADHWLPGSRHAERIEHRASDHLLVGSAA